MRDLRLVPVDGMPTLRRTRTSVYAQLLKDFEKSSFKQCKVEGSAKPESIYNTLIKHIDNNGLSRTIGLSVREGEVYIYKNGA